jgi:hypothetical protein
VTHEDPNLPRLTTGTVVDITASTNPWQECFESVPYILFVRVFEPFFSFVVFLKCIERLREYQRVEGWAMDAARMGASCAPPPPLALLVLTRASSSTSPVFIIEMVCNFIRCFQHVLDGLFSEHMLPYPVAR